MNVSTGRRSFLVAAVALLGGCAQAPAGEVEVMVLTRGEDGTYGFTPEVLDLESVAPLRSERFEFVGGATVLIEGSGERVVGGAPLHVRVAGGEPWVAVDYESMLALTAMHHYERGYRFFEELGLGTTVDAPARFTVLMYPRVLRDGLPISVFQDNAAFATDVGFIVARQALLTGDVPLAASESVMTHELGHAIFHHLVVTSRGRTALPEGYDAYYMSALNEGLADTFSIAATGNPAVLADAIPPGGLADIDARDVRLDWQLTEELHAAAEREAVSFYRIGTLVARTFWLHAELAQGADGERSEALRHGAALAFEALRTFEVDGELHAVDFFAHLLEGLPPESPDRALLCEALTRTFALVLDRVEQCS